jgi:membrane-bound lytic murein transglycosylase A
MKMSTRQSLLGFAVLTAAILAGCSSAPRDVTPASAPPAPEAQVSSFRVPPLSSLPAEKPRALKGQYVQVAWDDVPGWQSDDLKNYWANFVRNCRGLMRPTGDNLARPARANPRAWHAVCSAALNPATAPNANDGVAVRRFLQTYLAPWKLESAPGKMASGMVTGYYEPLVQGSRVRQGPYQWPLHEVPNDLLNIDLGSLYPELAGKRVRGKLDGNRVVPYDSRTDLSDPARQPPTIVWINDPVDNFFLQVQGSGRVYLAEGPDAGTTIRLAYANHNGHPYRSIGRWLVDQGQLTLNQASMQNIRAWAKKNPERVQEMLNANPAVVFFREEVIVDPSEGPKGSYGIPLGEQRSIAVDTEFVPLGTPVYLMTTMPSSKQPLDRMVFAQDTGTAIKGAARTDYFWGFGEQAGALAGRMKQSGQMWLLWPKSAGAPSAQ